MPSRDDFSGPNDAVFLSVEGEEIRIYEHYTVEMSVLNQPAAFSLRLGWGKTAAELIEKCAPGKRFELRIGPVNPESGKPSLVVQSGRIDRVAAPNGMGTVVEVKGRDYLAQLFDSFVEEERAFSERTYYDLTRKALDIVGLTEAAGHYLEPNNDNNRQTVTGTQVKPRKQTSIERIETGATTGGGKLVYKTHKAKLGTRWYDFLHDQYKLAGLFLWATGEGNFCLARPNATTEPAYVISRRRGQTRNFTNIIGANWQNDTTGRHSRCIVYGRGGGTKGGRQKVRGEFIDEEITALGFNKPLVLHDDEIETKAEADYVARRHIAEERRNGWNLEYEVSGHTVPSRVANGAVAVWGFDLVCRVDDDDLNIHRDMYIESIAFSRNPQTTTRIKLMRKEDLVFAENLF